MLYESFVSVVAMLSPIPLGSIMIKKTFFSIQHFSDSSLVVVMRALDPSSSEKGRRGSSKPFVLSHRAKSVEVLASAREPTQFICPVM